MVKAGTDPGKSDRFDPACWRLAGARAACRSLLISPLSSQHRRGQLRTARGDLAGRSAAAICLPALAHGVGRTRRRDHLRRRGGLVPLRRVGHLDTAMRGRGPVPSSTMVFPCPASSSSRSTAVGGLLGSWSRNAHPPSSLTQTVLNVIIQTSSSPRVTARRLAYWRLSASRSPCRLEIVIGERRLLAVRRPRQPGDLHRRRPDRRWAWWPLTSDAAGRGARPRNGRPAVPGPPRSRRGGSEVFREVEEVPTFAARLLGPVSPHRESALAQRL